jgi:membrane associated rhomboid family serine protease
MLEYDLGSRRFLYLWLAASLIGVLPLVILKQPVVGMLVPGAILVTIWATRNPNQTVMVFMIIPVAAKWIGIAAVLGVFASYSGGTAQPLIGLAAVVGCIIGFLYARDMIPNLSYGRGSMNKQAAKPTRAQKAREKEYYDDVYRREKEREEKERLRKLFEGSLDDKK